MLPSRVALTVVLITVVTLVLVTTTEAVETTTKPVATTAKAGATTAKISWVIVLMVVFGEAYSRYRLEVRFHYLRLILGAGLCVSRASGAVINLGCALVLLPMCPTLRRLSRILGPACLSRLFMDATKGVHMCGAYTVVVAGGVHTIAHLVNAVNFSRNYSFEYPALNAAQFPGQNPLQIILNSVAGATGVLLVSVLCLLVISSLHCIRSRSFNVFWYVHRLFVAFIVLVVVHPLGLSGVLKEQTNSQCWPSYNGTVSGGCEPIFSPQGSSVWIWVGPSIVLYSVDVLYRCVKRRRPAAELEVKLHPAAVLELQFKIGFTVKPGQCASVPGDFVSAHIKCKGDWSGGLQRILSEDANDLEKANCDKYFSCFTKLYVDGPFSSTCEDVLQNPVNICIAGGIGVTPFAAALHSILYEARVPKLERLHLIWLCPNFDGFMCFAQLLVDVHFKLWAINRPDIFDFQLHVTRSCSNTDIKEKCGEKWSFLLKRINNNKPDWERIFTDWTRCYPSRSITVFTCGPKGLCHAIKGHCRRFNRNRKSSFVFRHESFA